MHGNHVTEIFRKDTAKKDPFCRVFFTVFEGNSKLLFKRKGDHSYGRMYKHEISTEMSQAIEIHSCTVLSVCIRNHKYKIVVQCYLKFQIDDF